MIFQTHLFNEVPLILQKVTEQRFNELLKATPNLTKSEPIGTGKQTIHQWTTDKGYVRAQMLTGIVTKLEEPFLFALPVPTGQKLRKQRNRKGV